MSLEAEFNASPERMWQLCGPNRADLPSYHLTPGSRGEYHLTGPEASRTPPG